MSTTYKLQATGVSAVLDDGSVMFIPEDDTLLAWQQYQGWVAAGNTPQTADPPVDPTPPSLTADDLATLLVQKGVLKTADVAAAVAQPAQALNGSQLAP